MTWEILRASLLYQPLHNRINFYTLVPEVRSKHKEHQYYFTTSIFINDHFPIIFPILIIQWYRQYQKFYIVWGEWDVATGEHLSTQYGTIITATVSHSFSLFFPDVNTNFTYMFLHYMQHQSNVTSYPAEFTMNTKNSLRNKETKPTNPLSTSHHKTKYIYPQHKHLPGFSPGNVKLKKYSTL